MHCRNWTLLAALIGGLLGGHPGVAPVDGSEPHLGLASQTPAKQEPLRIVVLTNGQVFTGPVSQRIEGYMVQVPEGEVLVPHGMVRVVASSIPDAYTRMHDNLVNPTANERLDLAQWCLQQNLLEEARTETMAALRLEPERREGRMLLQQIESRLHKPTVLIGKPSSTGSSAASSGTSPVVPNVLPPSGAKPAGGAADNGPGLFQQQWQLATLTSDIPEPAGGLSREAVSTFVRQIQPLLQNRCGNAACHGSQVQNRLRLHPFPANRPNRLESDRNLSTLMGLIEPRNAEGSPLLARALEQSGPHAKLFVGPRAEQQRQALVEWVTQVAGELKPRAPLPSGRTAKTPWNPPSGSQRHAIVTVSHEEPAATSAATPPIAGATPLPIAGEPVDEALLRKILAEEQPDAFDPDVFNRRVHGIDATVFRSQRLTPTAPPALAPAPSGLWAK